MFERLKFDDPILDSVVTVTGIGIWLLLASVLALFASRWLIGYYPPFLVALTIGIVFAFTTAISITLGVCAVAAILIDTIED